jgi:zinc and cadmium transporter
VERLLWIVGSGLLMTAVSLVGGLALLLEETVLRRMLLPLVAFSAGSLIGGAFFHMIPAAVAGSGSPLVPLLWVVLGFTLFLAVEQFLHYHHCHRASAECRKPLTYLILLGDGLHNFLGGLAIGSTFLLDVRLGVATWLAAAAHEVPQELGDFGVLLHGGWSKGEALLFNALSASTFLVGGLVAYAASARADVAFLVPLAAGNFLYIGAADLVPEVNKPRDLGANFLHLAAFVAGVGLLLLLRLVLPEA